MSDWKIQIIESPHELEAVEELQRVVWPGDETEVVPVHMLVAAIHNGGLVIGATGRPDSASESSLLGFVFGFPGIYFTADGPRSKHCSHMLAVHPDYRNSGLGFALKRAQWQMVRHQKLDLITWTYDPLLSRNAHLNITKLGAICNRYVREMYGDMRDGLNAGLPSDRFEIEWWVNSKRVERRLSRKARLRLDLAHYFAGGAEIINPSTTTEGGWPRPGKVRPTRLPEGIEPDQRPLVLVEIPSDFQALRTADASLALEWRRETRLLFEDLFNRGYLVTDFVYLPGTNPRSFYVLSHGESTL